ncbi:MAG TPA: GlsB/YeaQ/YmgE family stress response membrane protein [Pirellula sp.]|nr:GlsB/YeaQ/YmgE family stress response membrane protein [Pirellula sp.]
MAPFMWWLIIGFVAGGLARLLVPGRQSMGWVATMALGLIGSVVGGLLSSLIFGHGADDPVIRASGLFMSTVGAMLALGIYLGIGRRRVT